MKIVIDMTEHEYEVAKKNGWSGYFYSEKIKNGTPLPKGHGRIGDLDAFIDAYRYCFLNDAVDSSKTFRIQILVEADKEEDAK